MGDTSIIYNIHNGDDDELGKLYLKLKPEFIKLTVKNHMISTDDATDIFTEALFAFRDNIVNNSLKELDVDSKTYIFRIGFNMIAKHVKERSKYENRDITDSAEEINNTDDDKLELLAEIMKAHMSERCNKLLKLYYFDRRSYKQIQSWLNFTSKSSVKSQKSKCIKKLKNLIKLLNNNNGKS